jgi:hypothetical protein
MLEAAIRKASVEFAWTEARLKGKLPSVINKNCPYFASKARCDEAHQKLVHHIMDYHVMNSPSK